MPHSSQQQNQGLVAASLSSVAKVLAKLGCICAFLTSSIC